MFKAAPVLLSLLATAVFGLTPARGQNQSNSNASRAAGTRAQPSESSATADEGILATVNGTPIVEADVRFALTRGSHNKEVPSARRTNALDTIIRQELVHQRAVELGLDANPWYQEKLRRIEAQADAFKRKALSALFWRDIAKNAEVSETEARQYFEENAARIRTELHVWQILWKKKGSAEQSLSDLQQGTSFEEVARKRFPGIPKTVGAPWDLGYLSWNQVPEPWRNVVRDLKKGQVSGIIRGPNNRYWIIKLIDRRENPDVTLESAKPMITAVLKNAKIEELREKTEQDLRAKASIVYLKDPIVAVEE